SSDQIDQLDLTSDPHRGERAPPDGAVTRRLEALQVVSFPLDELRLSVETHKPVGRRHDDTADGRDPDERDGRGRGVAPQGRALRHELRGYKEESGGQVEREAQTLPLGACQILWLVRPQGVKFCLELGTLRIKRGGFGRADRLWCRCRRCRR